MKTLQHSFTMNADKMGVMKFTQVKRENDVAMYRREYLDGTCPSFEVFKVQTIKAGSKLPNGEVVAEDYERYVTAKSKNAFFCNSADRANVRFDELLNEKAETVEDEEDETVVAKVKGKRGRPRVERPAVVLPTAKRFTMKDLLAVNPQWNQPMMYLAVKAMMADGKVIEVDRVKTASGRGKPSVVYSLK